MAAPDPLRKRIDMPTRTIVTGVGASGLSCVLFDGPASAEVALDAIKGFQHTVMWQLDVPPAELPAGGPLPDGARFVPPPGTVRFFRSVIPPGYPDAAGDVAAIAAEVERKLPGMMETLVPASGRGMRRYPTVDLFTVDRGRVVMLFEDRSRTELGPGDCVVQQSATHAWRNPFSDPCVITGVSIGLAAEQGSTRSFVEAALPRDG